jgi:putative ABC transport system ATP-binding protein
VTSPTLELREVCKKFPGTPPVRALNEVNLRVWPGELVAVVGASGSGKSTLLHIVGTLERPTTGVVRIAGADTESLSDAELSAFRAGHLGFVFQQFFLLPHIDVLGNVAHALLYRGMRGPGRRAAAATALDRVGLGHRLRHRPDQLSGGERQRVAIARALVGDPQLILADEPTGNLDSGTAQELLNLLRELNEAGSTIMIITHDRDIAGAASRRIELRDGTVVHDTGRLL